MQVFLFGFLGSFAQWVIIGLEETEFIFLLAIRVKVAVAGNE